MDMLRLQEQAKDRGFDSAEFWLSAPNGVFKAKWLDAYFGFFEITEIGDGFLTDKSLPPGCEGFWSQGEAQEHNDKVFSPLREALASLSAPDATA